MSVYKREREREQLFFLVCFAISLLSYFEHSLQLVEIENREEESIKL
jgi:hypothetical protein